MAGVALAAAGAVHVGAEAAGAEVAGVVAAADVAAEAPTEQGLGTQHHLELVMLARNENLGDCGCAHPCLPLCAQRSCTACDILFGMPFSASAHRSRYRCSVAL